MANIKNEDICMYGILAVIYSNNYSLFLMNGGRFNYYISMFYISNFSQVMVWQRIKCIN
jgi:hypothetical protein